MKAAALPLSLILVLGAFTAPAAAQDEAQAALDAEAVVACLRLTGDAPLDDVVPAELGQLLVDGEVQVEVLDPEVCSPEEPEEAYPSEQAEEQEGTPYVKFVARGAGAAIELAALAEKHEGIDSLAKLDAAAVSVAAWAKQQRKWLDKQPPQACYTDVHKQWRKGVVQVRKAAKAARQSIRTLEPAPMRKAVRQMWAGIENLVGVDLDAAGEACAEAR